MEDKYSEIERIKIIDFAKKTLFENSDDSIEALDYLRVSRRLDDKTIQDYNFGYVPLRANHSLRGRIIMPIFNLKQEPIALTTRNFRNKDFAHWHESFDKKSHLFGLNNAIDHMIKDGFVILVEGQFDTCVCSSNGIKNVCGILGSSPSYNHIIQITRYCSEVVISFDSDSAGEKAFSQFIDIFQQKRMSQFDIKFSRLILDKFKDPDEFIKNNGIEKFKQKIEEARNVNTVTR